MREAKHRWYYKMDYLTRVHEGPNLKWKYPVKPYKDNLKAQSIVECIIDGEWDVSKERNMTYTLRNYIIYLFTYLLIYYIITLVNWLKSL